MRSVAKAATNVHRNFVHEAIRTVQYIGEIFEAILYRGCSLSERFSIGTFGKHLERFLSVQFKDHRRSSSMTNVRARGSNVKPVACIQCTSV